LAQYAARRRRNLDRDLVGLDFNQRLICPNALADRLQPALQLRTDAFELLGRADLDVAHVDRFSARRSSAAPLVEKPSIYLAPAISNHTPDGCVFAWRRQGGGKSEPAQALATDWIARTMRSTLGTTASSNSGLCGLGTSGMVTRSIGASRSKNASRASTAAISAPKPAVRLSSWTIRQRRVLRTDSSTASRSHGASVRKSSTAASTADCAAALSQRSTMAPQVTIVSSAPGRINFALPKGTTKSSPG